MAAPGVSNPRNWISPGLRPSSARLAECSRSLARTLLGEGFEAEAVGDSAKATLRRAFEISIDRALAEASELVPDVAIGLMAAHDALAERPEPAAGRRVDANVFHDSTRTETAMATRWLVEAVASIPPTGRRALTRDRWNRLVSWGQTAQRFGMFSDAVWKGLSAFALEVSCDGVAVRGAGGFGDASLQAATQSGGQLGYDYVRNSELELATKVCRAELQVASKEIEQLVGFPLAALSQLRFEAERRGARDIHAESHRSLLARLGALGLTAQESSAFLTRFSLAPDPSFNPRNDPSRQPHRMLRAFSYVRRPFVHVGMDVVWSWDHLPAVESDLLNCMITHRLNWTPEVQRACQPVSNRLDGEFNKRLARAIRRNGAWRVFENVVMVGGQHIAGARGTLGDVDILAVHRTEPLVLAVETKRLAPSLGAYEMWREQDRLLKDKGYVARHLARVQWLRAHGDAVSDHIDRNADWTVVGAIATTVPLLSGQEPGELPIVPFWDVLANLNDPDLRTGGFAPHQLRATHAWPELR